jgi:Uncharacterized protein conserved in bacteria (DUF2199)
MPAVGAEVLLYFYGIPAEQRQPVLAEKRHCIVDQMHFFVRGCLEIPVHGEAESFSWESGFRSAKMPSMNSSRVSTRRSARTSDRFLAGCQPSCRSIRAWRISRRACISATTGFARTSNSSHHPLAVEQRNGISVDRVAEIYACYEHRPI